ncbi:MAG: PEP/pyruvate-binding domain-containing protein [Anaerolineae bacterium]
MNLQRQEMDFLPIESTSTLPLHARGCCAFARRTYNTRQTLFPGERMSSADPMPCILLLASPAADLPAVGGKGANLVRLLQAGLPVPDGFCLTTAAYRAYAAANRLAERIPPLLAPSGAALDDRERASAAVRSLFRAGDVPPDLAKALFAAYAALGEPHAAVRSSALAEDLPEASFAGQHETVLNVASRGALLEAVVRCWASLWTARAVDYRAGLGLTHDQFALAVVVQRMVASESSGVLFTANPLSGLRREAVIDATLGLGEPLVSGQVEPDHYVVDSAAHAITGRTLGAKQRVLRALAEGGTAVDSSGARETQALPDAAILELAGLGERFEDLLGGPQDIEWAWAGGKLWLLQARPITTLYPLPDQRFDPLDVYLSFAAVQGLLEPLTPLGRDFIRQIMATASRLFGLRVTRGTQRVLASAGGRLWMRITPALHNTVGRRILLGALGYAEPGSLAAVNELLQDPRLAPGPRRFSPRAALRIAGFLVPMAGRVLLNLAFPEPRREYIVAHAERILVLTGAERTLLAGAGRERLAQAAEWAPGVIERRLLRAFELFLSGVASGMASYALFNKLAGRLARSPEDAAWLKRLGLEATGGMPHNPTTEMDLALWRTARSLASDAGLQALFKQQSPAQLAQLYRQRALPPRLQQELDAFLALYGGRGLGEVDLGRPRWGDDPAPIPPPIRGPRSQSAAPRAHIVGGANTVRAPWRCGVLRGSCTEPNFR